jgi:hypothetical protein
MLPGYVPQLLVLVLELGNSASHSARVAYLAAATGLFQDSTQMPPEAYIAMQPYLKNVNLCLAYPGDAKLHNMPAGE